MLMSCQAGVSYSHVIGPVKRADTRSSSPLPQGQQTPSRHSKLRNGNGALKQNSKKCAVALLLSVFLSESSFLLD